MKGIRSQNIFLELRKSCIESFSPGSQGSFAIRIAWLLPPSCEEFFFQTKIICDSDKSHACSVCVFFSEVEYIFWISMSPVKRIDSKRPELESIRILMKGKESKTSYYFLLEDKNEELLDAYLYLMHWEWTESISWSTFTDTDYIIYMMALSSDDGKGRRIHKIHESIWKREKMQRIFWLFFFIIFQTEYIFYV